MSSTLFLLLRRRSGLLSVLRFGMLGIGLFLCCGLLSCLSFLSWGVLKLPSFPESCQPEAMPRHATSISAAGCRSPRCWTCFMYAGTVSEHWSCRRKSFQISICSQWPPFVLATFFQSNPCSSVVNPWLKGRSCLSATPLRQSAKG